MPWVCTLRGQTTTSWAALLEVGRGQIKPFAIIQSFFQLVQMLQVKNYKTQPSCSQKFFKLGIPIDKFK
jgi:hypothetical protein